MDWTHLYYWPLYLHLYYAITGAANEAGKAYGFWSGFGGTVLFSAAVVSPAWYLHHCCSVTGCFWYSFRKTATGEPACWRHHPHKKRTVEDLHADHWKALGK